MKKLLFFTLVFGLGLTAMAGDKDSTKIKEELISKFVDSLESSFKWQTGTVNLSNNAIKLNIPQNFRFLNAEQSQYILEDIWGNLKDGSVLGMVFPATISPLSDSAWAYVVTYDQMGYVKDNDADDINYDDLLKDMRKDSEAANAERAKQGMGRFDLVGWAQKPFYDKEHKVLHWAKEYKSEGATQNTLNYDVRVLGRKGVLSLNAVASMSQLNEVKSNVDAVLKMAQFNDGFAYKDFDSNIDQVAAWTIGGLVAGKVLAKVGIFALIAKFGKIIVIGLVAAGGAIWKFVTGRRRKNEEYAPVTENPNDQA